MNLTKNNDNVTIYFIYKNKSHTSTLSSRMWDFASERSDVKSCTFKKM